MGNALSSICPCIFGKSADSATTKPLVVPKPPAPVDPLPKPPAIVAEGSDPDKIVRVLSANLLIAENGPLHHTSSYDVMEREDDNTQLVIRRGTPFFIQITMQKPYDHEKDAMSIIFKVKDAAYPNYGSGTLVAVPILPVEEKEPEGWSAKFESTEGRKLKIKICPTADCIIGEWMFDIDTKSLEINKSLSYSHPKPIVILFNTWCADDVCYLEKEDERTEYVLCETGKIWRGTKKIKSPCSWAYAQFEESVLSCALYLISEVGNLRPRERDDPVRISRVITSVANDVNNNGVLSGNWSGDYEGGVSPVRWTGSTKILQQYFKTKQPVKFGQCWVFSGIVTSLCRTLGIPARSVTNFCSAHDTHGSLTIDHFYDSDGSPVEDLNADSIWNFHVWNEAWMKRPDLEPKDYHGWQAIDATPQEPSDGIYRCGPASVKAIKEGDVKKGFDAPFLFSEVNADEVYWRYSGKNAPMKLVHINSESVGQFISTKAVGCNAREDLTNNYKESEMSPSERAVMLKALRLCEARYSRYYLNQRLEDIQFNLQLQDDILIGKPFDAAVKVTNKNPSKSYKLRIILRVDTKLYTGAVQQLVKTETFEKTLEGGEDCLVTLPVEFDDYYKKLCEQCAMNIACLATVEETQTEYFTTDDFRVIKPEIVIKTNGEIKPGREFKVTASFQNPLPIPIKKGEFEVEGPGLGMPLEIPVKKAIAAEGEAEVTFKLKAKSSGEKTILVRFCSSELEDVDGSATIEVLKPV